MTTSAATPRIDPRLRARRIAVQRDEGRRRLRRFVLALVLAAVVAALWGVTRTPLLDVDTIEVAGADHSGIEAVVGATGIARGDALLTVDLGRAARRIAALPWVQTVDVARRWPGTVTVKVVERAPAASVPVKDGGWLLLDAEGRQLAIQPDEPTGVLTIEVSPIVPALGTTLDAGASAPLRLAAALPDALRDRLRRLRPTPGGTVEGTVTLRNGRQATVLFGQPVQLAAKWLALLSVLDEADPARLARIDVRVPAAPALTRN